jgi:uncharacterized protein (TIGR03083 family)
VNDDQRFVEETYSGLAAVLAAEADDAWDVQSLCDKWLVRHVVAHVTMPVRLTPERFGEEMAAAKGDFGLLSDTVALRDGSLPVGDLLDQLRSPELHAWVPPGGGPAGAVTHAIVHSMDVTIALGAAPVAPLDARLRVLEHLTEQSPPLFGVSLDGLRLEATDADWSWGQGRLVRADSAGLVALLGGRRLPDGSLLPSA